jgi:hypothetical protein
MSFILSSRVRSGLFSRDLHDYQFTLSFTALSEPCAQTLPKTLWRQAEAGLDPAVSHGERVVKVRGVCEIAHAELIEPIKRAGAALAANHDIHFEFLRVHATIITLRWSRFGRTN